jgi:hypothetical protein
MYSKYLSPLPKCAKVAVHFADNISTSMNQALLPTPSSQDRFFVGNIDGRQTLFVLHAADHSISIALLPGPVTIEPADKLIAELSGLAA